MIKKIQLRTEVEGHTLGDAIRRLREVADMYGEEPEIFVELEDYFGKKVTRIYITVDEES